MLDFDTLHAVWDFDRVVCENDRHDNGLLAKRAFGSLSRPAPHEK